MPHVLGAGSRYVQNSDVDGVVLTLTVLHLYLAA